MVTGTTTFQHSAVSAIGVLVTNLGTPDAPTASALRRYLKQFLWDPRVVEIPRPLWWLILNGVILQVRPKRSAEAYTKVWTAEGSPLLVHSQHQAHALQEELAARYTGPVKVALAMRYGQPSIEEGLHQLREAGAGRILVLPLYPQYSAATTASTFDAVAAALKRWRWLPELRFVNHYHDHPLYIAALAESIREYWDNHGRPQRLLFSFHGMPRRTLLAGDPYHCHCQKTARLVVERLALEAEEWMVVFQSRFGREEWLKPYAADTLAQLPAQGIRKVDVVCPGFSADCLETLEEMAMQNRELFEAAGGESYRYIAALNARPDHITALADLIGQHLQGWPEAGDWGEQAVRDRAEETRVRALKMGAAQ